MVTYTFKKLNNGTILVTEHSDKSLTTFSPTTEHVYTASREQIARAITDSGACRNSRKTLKFCDCFACQLTKFIYS